MRRIPVDPSTTSTRIGIQSKPAAMPDVSFHQSA
jgi:hypothetical protein